MLKKVYEGDEKTSQKASWRNIFISRNELGFFSIFFFYPPNWLFLFRNRQQSNARAGQKMRSLNLMCALI